MEREKSTKIPAYAEILLSWYQEEEVPAAAGNLNGDNQNENKDKSQ